jgi:hypothetical protein
MAGSIEGDRGGRMKVTGQKARCRSATAAVGKRSG